MTKAVSKKIEDLVQLCLEVEYGTGKVKVSVDGKIRFIFPETHYGCNEMEVGYWSLKNKKIQYTIVIDYIEAFEHLKCGTKPQRTEIIDLLIPKSIA